MSWADLGPLLVTLLVAAAAALFVLRHGGGAALEQLERANSVLERRVKELETRLNDLQSENTSLKAKTDIALALGPVREQLERQHGEAVERFRHMETLLGMIADRLGPDPETA